MKHTAAYSPASRSTTAGGAGPDDPLYPGVVAVRALVDGGVVRVNLTGASAVWALRRRVEASLDQVVSARVADRATAQGQRPLLRWPGTHLPGVITAGTYRGLGSRTARQFWSVRRSGRVLVVDLDGGRYARLVLELPDPDGTATVINAALLSEQLSPPPTREDRTGSG